MEIVVPTQIDENKLPAELPFILASENIDVTIPTREPSVYVDAETGAYSFDCIVIDEGTRKQTTYTNQLGTYSNDKSRLVIDAETVNDTFYYIIVYQGTYEIAKFKLFATQQTDLPKYEITQGEFTEAPQGSNDFIVL